MENQSRDSFPSDTNKNPKENMVVTIRSGKEFKGNKEAEKKQTEAEIEKAKKNSSSREKQ